jgi:hypothetical protein
MPARDGTGPKGTGPAGRGLGPCATTAGRRFLGLGRGFRGGGGGGARARGDGFGLGYGYASGEPVRFRRTSSRRASANGFQPSPRISGMTWNR